jgi:hypothetical protein
MKQSNNYKEALAIAMWKAWVHKYKGNTSIEWEEVAVKDIWRALATDWITEVSR